MYYYTVLTFPGGFPRQNLPNVLRFCDYYFDKYIVITENGRRGRNFHVNVVYSLKDQINEDSFYKNSKRNWIKVYEGIQLPEQTKHLIRNKQCTLPENVIGGYLQKETGKEILKNEGFDLQEMKDLADINRRENKPSLEDLVQMIDQQMVSRYKTDQILLNWMIDHQPDSNLEVIIKPYFQRSYGDLLREGYKIESYYKRLKEIYHIILIKYYSYDNLKLD